MKKKLGIVLLAIGLMFGFSGVAPVVTAAPAQAASSWNTSKPGLDPTFSSCHNHYGAYKLTGNYTERWCYLTFRSYDRWAYGYQNGWYSKMTWTSWYGYMYGDWYGPKWHAWHTGY